jgi:hypothetical protein
LPASYVSWSPVIHRENFFINLYNIIDYCQFTPSKDRGRAEAVVSGKRQVKKGGVPVLVILYNNFIEKTPKTR